MNMNQTQLKQSEWFEQWSLLEDNELFLFQEWISPLRLEDFKGKEVLEGGCGGGQHTSFVAPHAKEILAVDLNTVQIARERTRKFQNVTFLEADLATMNLEKQFDIVFSIGVIHHTDSPDKTFANLKRFVKPGGKIVIWVYSKEGNWLVDNVVEPIRKAFLVHLSRKALLGISGIITALLYLPVYSVYLLPLKFLPYFEYFANFRRLSFYRNTLNVFDKLNAPQVDFISKERIQSWFAEDFTNVDIHPYKGVSWTGIGTKRASN